MDSTVLPTGVPSVFFAYYCRLTEQVVEDFCQPLLFWLYDTTTTLCRQDEEIAPTRQLTFRAVATGLCVGSILCFSNTYFGLQTGWVTMGSLQSAILGFGVFRVLHCFDCMKGFTVEENVIVQTTSVATATMPLAAGKHIHALVHYIEQHHIIHSCKCRKSYQTTHCSLATHSPHPCATDECALISTMQCKANGSFNVLYEHLMP